MSERAIFYSPLARQDLDEIFYRVTDSRIFVDRILYKRRDYLPLLGLQ